MKRSAAGLSDLGPSPFASARIASNATQAQNVFFTKLSSRIKSPCFYEFRPKIGKAIIEFPNGIRLHSLHAANESWEGYNILAWVMDEASAFQTRGGKDNALACYNTLRTSATSRFMTKRWIGIVISFPRKQAGHFTLNKYEEALTNPRMFGDRAAHWDVHPRFDPDHPMYAKDMKWEVIPDLNIRVPEPLVAEFKKDPTDCRTKYMCDPPPQEFGFFEIPQLVDQAVNLELPALVVTWDTVERPLDSGRVMKYVSAHIDQLPPVQEGCRYFMHGDPGLTNDAFALCVCHTVAEAKWITEADGTQREVPKVVVDFVLAWEPRPGVPVDLTNVEEVVHQVASFYGIRHVTFDRWNSAGTIQRLIQAGIMAEDLSFSGAQQLQMYRNLKMLFYNGLIELPYDEQTVKELVYLKVENGKITHDAYGKDRADAVAAVTWWANGCGKDPPECRVQRGMSSLARRYRILVVWLHGHPCWSGLHHGSAASSRGFTRTPLALPLLGHITAEELSRELPDVEAANGSSLASAAARSTS
jgi:hypothetical protein